MEWNTNKFRPKTTNSFGYLTFQFLLYHIFILRVNSDVSTEIIIETTDYDTSNIYGNETVTMSYSSSISDNTTDADILHDTSTEILNTNKTTKKKTKPMKQKKSKPPKKHKMQQKTFESCYCDLMKHSCDVNCCCDVECSEDDKSIFSQCTNKTSVMWFASNLKYCNAETEYSKNPPWFVDILSNSLLCVLKDNLPPKVMKKYYKTITNSKEVDLISRKHFSWPSTTKRNPKHFDNTKNYHFGDNVYVVFNSTIQNLNVPFSTFNTLCDGWFSIKYLQNIKSQCTNTPSNLMIEDITNNIKMMRLISLPNLFNDTWISSPQDCPQNICISFNHYLCNDEQCKIVENNTSLSGLFLDENNDTNMITSATYHLFSNGTMGYTCANIYFGYIKNPHNLSYIEQYFEVSHIWISKNNTFNPKSLSGNPNYLIGKPIIISKLIPDSHNNSNISHIFDYFVSEDDYPLRNVIFVPKTINGFCKLSNISYEMINFGENIHIICKVLYKINNTPKKMFNATNICHNLQKQLLAYVLENAFSENKTKNYVSVFGNPVDDINDWIELINEIPEHDLKGEFQDDHKLLCKNFLREVLYEFIYVYISLSNNEKTVKLIGSDIKYVIEKNIQFDIINNEINNYLIIKSRFYDGTIKQTDEYAKGPRLHITLPNDFFYPFTYNCGFYTTKSFLHTFLYNAFIIYLFITNIS